MYSHCTMRPWNAQAKAIEREKRIAAYFKKNPLTVDKVFNEIRVWTFFGLGVFALVLVLGVLSIVIERFHSTTPPTTPAASVVPTSAPRN
jgi:hypothetical protein